MKKAVLLSVILLTTGFCEDLFELGVEAYNKGEFDKAAKQWQRGGNGGDIDSCTNLGTLYENGQGVARDYNKAAALYKHACDSKDAIGCYNLGGFYERGQGVEQDYTKAVKLYKKSL